MFHISENVGFAEPSETCGAGDRLLFSQPQSPLPFANTLKLFRLSYFMYIVIALGLLYHNSFWLFTRTRLKELILFVFAFYHYFSPLLYGASQTFLHSKPQ